MKDLTGIKYVKQMIHGGESSEFRSINSDDYATINQFINYQSRQAPMKQNINGLVSIIVLAICIFNVYLSWTCNTSQNIGTAQKVIYAFFAFTFGLFYTLYYFFVRAGTCKLEIGKF
jgi:hypothetical protein